MRCPVEQLIDLSSSLTLGCINEVSKLPLFLLGQCLTNHAQDVLIFLLEFELLLLFLSLCSRLYHDLSPFLFTLPFRSSLQSRVDSNL